MKDNMIRTRFEPATICQTLRASHAGFWWPLDVGWEGGAEFFPIPEERRQLVLVLNAAFFVAMRLSDTRILPRHINITRDSFCSEQSFHSVLCVIIISRVYPCTLAPASLRHYWCPISHLFYRISPLPCIMYVLNYTDARSIADMGVFALWDGGICTST